MNIDKHATIVDVRTPAEFSAEHFPGSINIPLTEVAKRIKEFEKLPKPIVAYCRSGNRSGIAVTILRQSGIAEVVNGGGLSDMFQSKIN